MKYIVFDIEADGPIIGIHSMISIGAVCLDSDETFYGELKPIGDKYVKEALAVSGFSREDTMNFKNPEEVIQELVLWLQQINSKNERLMFCSDNVGFDFAWVNWYLLYFNGNNPFGHTSFNINTFYKGLTKDLRKNIRHLRYTKHTHNALDDAKGNAEAMLAIAKEFNIKFR